MSEPRQRDDFTHLFSEVFLAAFLAVARSRLPSNKGDLVDMTTPSTRQSVAVRLIQLSHHFLDVICELLWGYQPFVVFLGGDCISDNEVIVSSISAIMKIGKIGCLFIVGFTKKYFLFSVFTVYNQEMFVVACMYLTFRFSGSPTVSNA